MTKEKLQKANEIATDIIELERYIEIFDEYDCTLLIKDYNSSIEKNINKKHNIAFVELMKNLIRGLEKDLANL